MKLFISPLALALALALAVSSTLAYLPDVSSQVQKSKETQAATPDPGNDTLEIQIPTVKTRLLKRSRANGLPNPSEFHYFSFTPGPIPASYSIRPKAGCPGGSSEEGSSPDGSFGTTPGASPGNGQAKSHGVLSKAMLLALALGVVGIRFMAERHG
jgi:hypothetical protein